MSNFTTRTPSATHTRLSTVPTSASKSRQLSHLHAQLAQLTAHMSDLENLLRMTAVQAEGMRGLGGYAGGMYVFTCFLVSPELELTWASQVHGCEQGAWGGDGQRGQCECYASGQREAIGEMKRSWGRYALRISRLLIAPKRSSGT